MSAEWVVVPVEPTEEMVRAIYSEPGTWEHALVAAIAARPTGPEVPLLIDASELEALRRDAGRYRWLRHAQAMGHFDSGYSFNQSASEFDAAVDRTMARVHIGAICPDKKEGV